MVQVRICHMHILCIVHVVSLTYSYMYSGTPQSGHSEIIGHFLWPHTILLCID